MHTIRCLAGPLTRSLTHLLTGSLPQLPIQLPTQSLTGSLTDSLIQSPTQSLTRSGSLTESLTGSLSHSVTQSLRHSVNGPLVKLLTGVAGMGAIALFCTPALAQTSNQSDITGPNVSDITGPNVSDITGPNVSDNTGTAVDGIFFDDETIAAAQLLAAELEEAYAACVASAEGAPNQPRRFARGTGSSEPCVSAECARLNQLMEEARLFLGTLEPAQREQLGFNPNLRLW